MTSTIWSYLHQFHSSPTTTRCWMRTFDFFNMGWEQHSVNIERVVESFTSDNGSKYSSLFIMLDGHIVFNSYMSVSSELIFSAEKLQKKKKNPHFLFERQNNPLFSTGHHFSLDLINLVLNTRSDGIDRDLHWSFVVFVFYFEPIMGYAQIT